MLFKALRNQLFSVIDGVQPSGKYKLLIIDEKVRTFIQLVASDHEILNREVANIALITDKRNVESYLEAVYIVEQSKFSYDCIQADFAPPKARYKAAHVFVVPQFLSSDSEFAAFKNSPSMRNYLQKCEVLPMSMLVLGKSLFTTNSWDSNLILYNPECKDIALQKAENIARNIAMVCQTLEIRPYIRFSARWKITRSNAYPALIAKQAAQLVENSCSKFSKQPTLLILDRTCDLTAPLRHEFEFQALALDVLESRFSPLNTLQNYKHVDVEGKLNSDDKVWSELRGKHVVEATELLNCRIAELKRQNPHLADPKQQASVKDVRQMLAHLPEFMTTRDNVTLSLDVALGCMDEIERQHLKPVAEFEQNAILGPMHNRFSQTAPQNPLCDTEGVLAEKLVELLASDIPKQVKLRALAIYYVHRNGLCEQDIERLIRHCRLQEEDINVLNGLSYLGSPRVISLPRVDSGGDVAPPSLISERDVQPFLFSRLQSAVYNICVQLVNNRLNQEEYPYAGETPSYEQESLSSAKSMRNPRQRATWAQTVNASQAPPTNQSQGPLVIYMVGGVTSAEAIAVKQISDATDVPVVIGGDDLLTPSKFLHFLGNINKPRAELNLDIDRPKQQVPKHLLDKGVPKPVQPVKSKSVSSSAKLGPSVKPSTLHKPQPINNNNTSTVTASASSSSSSSSYPQPQVSPKKSSKGKLPVPHANPYSSPLASTPMASNVTVIGNPYSTATNIPNPQPQMHELKLHDKEKDQSKIKKLRGAFKLKK